jgi:hypothetical protein
MKFVLEALEGTLASEVGIPGSSLIAIDGSRKE